jgi:hypothetical protein
MQTFTDKMRTYYIYVKIQHHFLIRRYQHYNVLDVYEAGVQNLPGLLGSTKKNSLGISQNFPERPDFPSSMLQPTGRFSKSGMKLQSNAIFYRQLTFQNFHKQHFAVHQYTILHITFFLYKL